MTCKTGAPATLQFLAEPAARCKRMQRFGVLLYQKAVVDLAQNRRNGQPHYSPDEGSAFTRPSNRDYAWLRNCEMANFRIRFGATRPGKAQVLGSQIDTERVCVDPPHCRKLKNFEKPCRICCLGGDLLLNRT
jgi:hypothetical protein